MRSIRLFVAVLLSAIAIVGCAGGSKYDKFGYSTVEKDGRLYVFPSNSAEYQLFTKTGEMGKSVTLVGKGPDGMTIIAPDKKVIDSYMGN